VDFEVFTNFICQKFKLCLFLRRLAKFGEDRTIRGRVIAYFQFSKWRIDTLIACAAKRLLPGLGFL